MAKIIKTMQGKRVIEGAGVALTRVFGFNDPKEFDPFLLLDDFSSDTPKDYLEGFPWHPHRGIIAVTYIIDGIVEHQDSLGNKSVIKSDEAQWMTAGSGIIHQEMPKKSDKMTGFQLWVNMPKSKKMIPPRYQDIKKIPVVKEDGTVIKVISGRYKNAAEPADNSVMSPLYFDVSIEKEKEFLLHSPAQNTTFAYVFSGNASFENTNVKKGELVHFKGDIKIKSNGVRFLFVSGKPLNEPVAWHGPIVMNTQDEIETAIEELNNGKFIKDR